jgi:sulfotransferase famil protein
MDDLYIFHHVPKCGGTTVSRIIDKMYHPSALYAVNSTTQGFPASMHALRHLDHASISKLCMIRGHQTYGLHRILKRPCKYFTILREPALRFVSAYFHAAYQTDLPLNRRIRENGVTLKELAEADDAVFGCDYLVRSFAAVPEAAHAADGALFLELAKNNLYRDFVAVGITEKMEKSVLLFCETFGWNIKGYRSQNINTKYCIDDIDPEVLAIFRQRNPNDVAFYEFAVSLWEKQVKEISSFEEKLKHFDSTNHVHNRWQDRIDGFKKPVRPVYQLLTRRNN